MSRFIIHGCQLNIHGPEDLVFDFTMDSDGNGISHPGSVLSFSKMHFTLRYGMCSYDGTLSSLAPVAPNVFQWRGLYFHDDCGGVDYHIPRGSFLLHVVSCPSFEISYQHILSFFGTVNKSGDGKEEAFMTQYFVSIFDPKSWESFDQIAPAPKRTDVKDDKGDDGEKKLILRWPLSERTYLECHGVWNGPEKTKFVGESWIFEVKDGSDSQRIVTRRFPDKGRDHHFPFFVHNKFFKKALRSRMVKYYLGFDKGGYWVSDSNGTVLATNPTRKGTVHEPIIASHEGELFWYPFSNAESKKQLLKLIPPSRKSSLVDTYASSSSDESEQPCRILAFDASSPISIFQFNGSLASFPRGLLPPEFAVVYLCDPSTLTPLLPPDVTAFEKETKSLRLEVPYWQEDLCAFASISLEGKWAETGQSHKFCGCFDITKTADSSGVLTTAAKIESGVFFFSVLKLI